MKSITGIKLFLDNQNVYIQCQFIKVEEQQFFYTISTSDGIQPRINYLNSAIEIKQFPIYYVVHETTNDEFCLYANFFNKQNNEIICVEERKTDLKWIHAFKKEYVLTYPNGLKIGNVFKQKLPTITKI